MAEKLARREQVAPTVDAVYLRSVAIHVVVVLARDDVEGVPFDEFLVDRRADRRAVVVLGPGRAVAPDPLVAAPPARLRPGLDPPLEGHRVELFAHPPRLRLPLDLAAVDHPAAVGVRAVPVAAGHRARKLLLGRADDLERADAARGSRTAGAVGQQPNPGPVRRQPPVRRQRHETVAVRAGDRARPEVGDVDSLRRTGLVVQVNQSLLDQSAPRSGDPLELSLYPCRQRHRPFDRGPQHKSGNRIEVVRRARQPEPHCLERDAPAAGRRVEDHHLPASATTLFGDPFLVAERRRIAEGPRVVVGVRHADARSSGPIDRLPRRHRIPVNPDDVQELLPVRVRRQQRRQDGRPRRHQRPARPPDVEVVRGRQRGHGPPLPHALLAERRNRQPAFDQADVRHLAATSAWRGSTATVTIRGKLARLHARPFSPTRRRRGRAADRLRSRHGAERPPRFARQGGIVR